jgi:hypothetical protein
MAIYGTNLTLADIARRMGGDQPFLVDALTNPNAGVTFGRLPMRQITGWVDQFTRIEGRPTVSWRRLGAYVAASKGQRNPYSEGVFLISGVSEVDKIRADRDPRGALALRAEEDWSFLESIGYNLSLQMFYGGTTLAAATDSFEGINARLPSSMTTHVNASNGSVGQSVYAFKLGPGKFMGIYNVGPSGKMIEANDYGAILDKDNTGSSNSQNEMYKTFFNAAFGIAQYDGLSIGRIAGVDAPTAATVPITALDFVNLYDKMKGKPDLLVTTFVGWGCISSLLGAKQLYSPGEKDYSPYIGSYDGIPVIVDTALIADAKM